jgi:glycosyltransferase involved in cell wall biosynthesis
MINPPLVTVIIPLYNKRETIKGTIDSVLTQDYPNIELLVVDDGSVDGSAEIVETISHPNLRLLRKVNGGAASARNYGITRAKGDWLLFLDADDTLLKNSISVLVNECDKGDIITGNYYSQKGNAKMLVSEAVKGGNAIPRIL